MNRMQIRMVLVFWPRGILVHTYNCMPFVQLAGIRPMGEPRLSGILALSTAGGRQSRDVSRDVCVLMECVLYIVDRMCSLMLAAMLAASSGASGVRCACVLEPLMSSDAALSLSRISATVPPSPAEHTHGNHTVGCSACSRGPPFFDSGQ